jgi:hypothetical protein
MGSKSSKGSPAKAAKAEASKPKETPSKQQSGNKYEEFLTKLDKVKKDFPENRCAKYLSRELFLSYTPEQQAILYRCAASGVENPDVSTNFFLPCAIFA